MVAPEALALQAPGVCTDYASFDRARAALDADLRAELASRGVELMALTDYGAARVFSDRPVERPSDLAQRLPWVMQGDRVLPALFDAIGARGMETPLEGARGAMEQHAIDTAITSAIIVRAAGWSPPLRYVSSTPQGVLIGAVVFDQARLDALHPSLRAVLQQTTVVLRHGMQRVRYEDQRYLQEMTQRGSLASVDVTRHRADWDEVNRLARERMVGPTFSRAALEAALAAAGN